MEFKKFKEQLRKEDGSVPEGLDWLSMEQGIKEKMDESKKRRFPYFWFLIGFIFLVQTSAFIFLIFNEENETLSITDNTQQIKDEFHLEETTRIPFAETVEKNTTSSSHHLIAKENDKTNSNAKNDAFENSIPNPNNDLTINEINSIKEVDQKEIKNTVPSTENTITSHSESINNIQIPDNSDLSESNTKTFLNKKLNLKSEQAKPFNSLPISILDKILLDDKGFENKRIKIKTAQQSKHEIAIYGGTTINSWNPNSDLIATTRNDAEQALLSYQINLDYKYFLAKNYFLKTGVSLHKNEYLFDYTGTSTEEVLLTDIHLRNEINPFLNQTTPALGDTLVDASVTREVKNYNAIRSINIPLYLGKRFSWNKIHFDLEAGPIFNVMTKGKGKTIDEHYQIISIEDNRVYKNNLGFALGGQVSMGYAITNKISFKIGANGHQFLSDKSGMNEVRFKPNSFGLIGGIGFKF